MNSTLPSEAAVLEALRHVIDPELGCNIVDLGLIYSVCIVEGRARVVMTLTSPGCPMHESIRWAAQNALLQCPGIDDAEVELSFDPPWHPSMMSEEGRQQTGIVI